MGKFIWLASYPKSGNTWMRALLTNYIRDGSEPASINELIGGPIASARFWFDEWAGIEASALSDEAIEQLRPGVYRCMADEAPEHYFLKVHDAWRRTANGEPLFPPEITAGVVYIMRNPLDLVSSCAHHWGLGLAEATERLCKPDFALARSHGALTDQLQQPLKSWSDHVNSWLEEAGLPTCLVRYEDLRADPQRVLGEVVRFCGLEYDSTRLDKAVAFADFAELQRQEQAEGFRERSILAPDGFFRRGQVNAWREELEPDLVRQLIACHGRLMRRYGYLDG